MPIRDDMNRKEVIIIAGGNGVGKTTWANQFLAGRPDCPFLNADNIAKEISPEDPGGSAISAGRAFLQSQVALIEQGKSFVIESTLSGRYLIKVIRNLRKRGYEVRIVFFFVDSPETLVQRIRNRVAKGGHFIPDADVKRRFDRGRNNFWKTYRNLVDSWDLFYNENEEAIHVATSDAGKIAVKSNSHFNLFLEMLDVDNV